MSTMMASSPRKPIPLMRREELVDYALALKAEHEQVVKERDHHKESVRCMSIVLDDLAAIVGVKSGDAEGLVDKVAFLKQAHKNLAAASEMLDVLERLQDIFRENETSDGVIKALCAQPDLGVAIHNAIAKAKGGNV